MTNHDFPRDFPRVGDTVNIETKDGILEATVSIRALDKKTGVIGVVLHSTQAAIEYNPKNKVWKFISDDAEHVETATVHVIG